MNEQEFAFVLVFGDCSDAMIPIIFVYMIFVFQNGFLICNFNFDLDKNL